MSYVRVSGSLRLIVKGDRHPIVPLDSRQSTRGDRPQPAMNFGNQNFRTASLLWVSLLQLNAGQQHSP